MRSRSDTNAPSRPGSWQPQAVPDQHRGQPHPVGQQGGQSVSTADDGSDPLAGAAAYHGPVLLAGTEDDIYAPGGVTRRIAEVHPGPEEVLLSAGSEHGI